MYMTENKRGYLAWVYFSIVFAFVLIFWIPAALLGFSIENTAGLVLFSLGGIGPSFAAILLLHLKGSKEERKDYWLGIIDLKRIPFKMYIFILLYFPIIAAIASFIDVAIGGRGGDLSNLITGLSNPLVFLQSIILLFFVGPFFEELGWRGYALPRLLVPYTALLSSLIIGIIWALWHLPLFFIEGTFQHRLSFLTPAFWLFMLGPVLTAFLYTWIFVNSNASIFSAILFHFMDNFTGEMFPLSLTAQIFRVGLLAITIAALLVLYDYRSFTDRVSDTR